MIFEPMARSAQSVHIYLVSRLALSPNGMKRASTSASPPSSFIGCVKKWFLSLRYVRRKPCIHLVSRLALSPNRLNRAYTWVPSPRSTIVGVSKMIFEPMVRLAQTMHLSRTDTNTISKWTKTRFHMCVQNDVWACGTFDANCASILRQA
jgi:hypothetical protein